MQVIRTRGTPVFATGKTIYFYVADTVRKDVGSTCFVDFDGASGG